MLLSTKHLSGFKILAKDEEIGKVHDFLIDDRSWIVRYIVVDIGNWLSGRKVLVVPSVAEKPDGKTESLPVLLSKKQVKESPGIDTDMPVSRAQEIKLHKHYQWEPYWYGSVFPVGPVHMLPTPHPGAQKGKSFPEDREEDENTDPHLRSLKECRNYKIHATDGEIGHIDDFIVDIGGWLIRYFVVDIRNWLPGKKVILSPSWIRDISWAESEVTLTMNRETVKASPEYNPSLPINMEYEARLYDYYGKPKYWS